MIAGWLTTSRIPLDRGVYFLTPESEEKHFEKLYLKLRQKEGRVYSDKIVASLPDFPPGELFNEWKIRENTSNRFFHYLKKRLVHLMRILDIRLPF